MYLDSLLLKEKRYMRLFIENEIQQCKEDFWRNFLEYALEKYL